MKSIKDNLFSPPFPLFSLDKKNIMESMNYLLILFGMSIALDRGRMNFKKISKLIMLAIIIMTYPDGLCFAGSGKATIVVSATVMARVSESIIHQEATINVTKDDLRKGFIEIPSGTILQIKTNARNGYALFFEGSNELFEEITVMEKGRTVTLSPQGGLVHQPYSGSNIEVKDLSYKFQLNKNIQPGTYPFPFRVKASLP